MTSCELRIGGLTPLTTIDYPGELAAVVFCQGCPWRCGYCQNRHLLPRHGESAVSWSEVLSFLRRRRGLLDAVVFSGGEPTAQQALGAAVREVRALGFKVGLHTAGPYPQRLASLLPYLDWVGMDIKAPLDGYDALTGVKGSGRRAWRSARLLAASGTAHELRTTVHPELLSPRQVDELMSELTSIGARTYAIQECATERCLREDLHRPIPPGYLDTLCRSATGANFARFTLRAV